jgi:hypothetical protein
MFTATKAAASYDQYQAGTQAFYSLNKSLKEKALAQNDVAMIDKYKEAPDAPNASDTDAVKKYNSDQKMREKVAKGLVRKYIEAYQSGSLAKAGVSSTSGFDFYDLRGPAYLLYPVNTPKRNKIPRVGKQNAGWGNAAHWKATRNLGSPYGGATEGNRVQTATPDEINYLTMYAQVGVERAVTDEAQWGGEGFTDVLADEKIRSLHQIFLQEESLIWMGNNGNTSTGLGFRLGTPATPTTALQSGAGLTTGQYVSVACVAITALGNPNNAQYGYVPVPSVAAGLTPTYTYTSPGTNNTITVNGGTSAISAISAPLQTTTGNNQVVATATPIKGAYSYAWFVDIEATNTGTLANAKLAAITTLPTYTVIGAAAGTQTGSATGLNVDSSFNATDFSGLLTMNAVTAGAYSVNMLGGLLTPGKDGTIVEFEAALLYIFTSFQCGVSAIWGSADAINAARGAILYGGSGMKSQIINLTRDQQGNMLGGNIVSGYLSPYVVGAMGGSAAIPLNIHPMLPAGTIYFDIEDNPYPQSRLDKTVAMLVRRDYNSEDWPRTTRQYTFGTYVDEVLAHYLPWIAGQITGIGGYAKN